METKKKTNGLTRALAVILAVVLVLGGGTFAYLTDSSDEKVNEFDTNYNSVKIDETTEGYEIVPGTSQDKDPVITATYTLASYVYVEVTDATDDLVEWYIANGWTKLDDASDESEGIYVYYMLLEENYDSTSGAWEECDDTTSEYYGWYTYTDSNGVTYYYKEDTGEYAAEIHVLKDDKVYYPSTITNEDMKNADDISLTFQAYIMQAEPFLSGNSDDADAGALAAYLAISGDSSAYVALGYYATVNGVLYETLGEAIAAVADGTEAESTTTITLLADVEDAEGISIKSNADLIIDFNGYTYTLTGPGAGSSGTQTQAFQLLKDSTIVMKNGTIRIAEGANNIKRLIQNYANLTLENMVFYAENQVGGEELVLSFNNGTIHFKGTTSIYTTSDDTTAFDVYYWASGYPNGTTVIFDDDWTGTINGVVLYDTTDASKATLEINGSGTIGAVALSSDAAKLESVNISITGGTFYNDITSYVADGYKATKVTIGGKDAYVVYPDATTVTNVTDESSLTSALSAASQTEGEYVIVLGADITVSSTVAVTGDDVTIVGNGMTLSGSATSGSSFVTVNTTGDFTMTDVVVAPSSTVSTNAGFYIEAADVVTITGCTFGTASGNSDVFYNGIEVNQNLALADGSSISGNTFYGNSFRHNCINIYRFEDGATIEISDNTFSDLDWDTTNAMRISNYSSATATINIADTVYTADGTDSEEAFAYAGLILFQNNVGSAENLTVNISNLSMNGSVVTENNAGTANQVYYVYPASSGTPAVKFS